MPTAQTAQSSPRVKVVICGSVDDGKSTLVARMLLDSGNMEDDDAAKANADPSGAALANVIDGLEAEREQAITIDVAYRYISWRGRSVVLIDCPGHEQYTRNVVTGASNADMAVVLVDATKGVTEQTWRHSRIAHLLGIVDFVFAVNKVDLVDGAESRFADISAAIEGLSQVIGLGQHSIVPVIATTGDMVVERGQGIGWYQGPTMFETILDFVKLPVASQSLRLPVQTVLRGNDGTRWMAGTISRGAFAVGDNVAILPGEAQATITAVNIGEEAVEGAIAGRSVTFALDRETDCSRGSIVCSAEDPATVADQFEAEIAWLGDTPMLPGRACTLLMAHQSVRATCQEPKFIRDVAGGQKLAAKTLKKNDIGVAVVTTARDIVADPYRDSPATGGFILVDRETGETIAAGMIRHALRRSLNIEWQKIAVGREARAMQKGQKPFVLWFTGLSGAGKTTIANIVEQRLFEDGLHSFLLDGDNVRMGLNKDLGFTQADRVENIRRVGEVARLMTDAGLIVLSTFISPFRAEREMVRDLVGEDSFIEVFVATPLCVAEQRDPKGLYAKARRGEILNFTGIDSPYEEPENPDIRLDTADITPDEAAEQIVRFLRSRVDVT